MELIITSSLKAKTIHFNIFVDSQRTSLENRSAQLQPLPLPPPLRYKVFKGVSFCNCPKKEMGYSGFSHQKARDGKIGGLLLTHWYHSFSSLLIVSSNKNCMCVAHLCFVHFCCILFLYKLLGWALINPQNYFQSRFRVAFQLLSKLTKYNM